MYVYIYIRRQTQIDIDVNGYRRILYTQQCDMDYSKTRMRQAKI